MATKKTTPKKAIKKVAAKKPAAKKPAAKKTKAVTKRTPAPAKALMKLAWDPKSKRDTEMAKEVFEIHREKRLAAFYMNAKGTRGAQMTTFDPKEGVMVFGPVPSRYDRINDGE